jgi:hypothetical protein
MSERTLAINAGFLTDDEADGGVGGLGGTKNDGIAATDD